MERIRFYNLFRHVACGLGMVAILAAGDARAQESCVTAVDCANDDPCTTSSCTLTEVAVPPPNCEGKIERLSFRYVGGGCAATTNTQEGKVICTGDAHGATPVRIVIRDKKYADVVYGDSAGIDINGIVSGSAAAGGEAEFKTESRAQILDASGTLLEDIVFHTSCSKPVNLGDYFGSLQVVSITTTEAGTQGLTGVCSYTSISGCSPCLTVEECDDADACTTDTCVQPSSPAPPHCLGKIETLSFRYMGGGCAATTNTQEGKVTCTGGAHGETPVRVVIRDKNYANVVYGDRTGIGINGIVSGSAAAGGEAEFKTESRAQILDASGTLLEDIVFHTSCSKPVNLGDYFGSLQVVSITTTEAGAQSALGVCGNLAISCDDENPCTSDWCDPEGGCANSAIPGCVPCDVAADCDDGNACTVAACVGGICAAEAIAGCTPCTAAGECPEAGACLNAICAAGRCDTEPVQDCVPCADTADCSDGNGCTIDACVENECRWGNIPSCTSCSLASDCSDHDPCTIELCSADNVCAYADVPGCVPCTNDTDCNLQDPCTSVKCGATSSCEVTEIPGCTPCASADECDDQNSCTEDQCSGGVCVYALDEGCTECEPSTEQCGDKIDNDCDGLIDCTDSNCSASPLCGPVEVCGDCIDNDANGLVDYEDPACCHQPVTLQLKSLKMRQGSAKRRSGKLRLRSIYSLTRPHNFDPLTQDTTIQISDVNGPLFCKTVEAKHWMHRGRKKIAFWDKAGEFGGGLHDGRFKFKRNGKVTFRTHGRRPGVRDSKGQGLRITVRVGDQCSRMLANVRARKQKLQFP